jgi:hypothetical protein
MRIDQKNCYFFDFFRSCKILEEVLEDVCAVLGLVNSPIKFYVYPGIARA